MAEKNSQIYLYKNRNKIKNEIKGLSLEKSQWAYLSGFIRKYRSIILVFVFLTFFQIFFEIVLPLISKSYIHKIFFTFDFPRLKTVIPILLAIMIIYLFISYFQIKISKLLQLYLTNDLREKWFKIALNKKVSEAFRQPDLIAKISYHFSLMQMGVTQLITNLLYLVLTFFVVVFFIPSINIKFLYFLPLVIILYSVVISIANIVVKKIISKEYTLSTKILKFFTESLYNLEQIQKSDLQNDSINKLKSLVFLDTHFRTRRAIWMSMSIKMIFIFISLALIIGFLVKNLFLEGIDYNSPEFISLTIIILVLMRLLYSAVKVGLYYFPAKLGLILSIPNRSIKIKKMTGAFTEITFQTKKAKFIPDGYYYKQLKLVFTPGDNVLIINKNFRESFELMKIFSGQQSKFSGPWIIKVDKNRYYYRNWSNIQAYSYVISSKFNSNSSVVEILTGKFREKIVSDDLQNIKNILSKYKVFNFLFSEKNKLSQDFQRQGFTVEEIVLIQIAYLVISSFIKKEKDQKKLIVIDPFIDKIDSFKITEAIELMQKLLNDFILINFVSDKNTDINYNKIYKFHDGRAQKIR